MFEINLGEDKIEVVDAKPKHKNIYYQIKKKTCEKYVEKYFGGWDNKKQFEYNSKIFEESLKQDCFKVITKNNIPIGFFNYSITKTHIGCVTLQILETKEKTKIFEWVLSNICLIAKKLNLQIYAKCFLGCNDINIYKKMGFEITNTTNSHYILETKKQGENMDKKQYEEFVKQKFEGQTQSLMLEQINNFYCVANQNVKNIKYKKNDNVVLNKNNLITGFKFDLNYLELIANKGKICGDFDGIETKHGVRWAVSTWKFAKKIKLKDYVTNYSGMTVVYNGNYEIVPYGKLDAFVEGLKNKQHFLWEAESTREMRFLPNDISQNSNIALIFNMGHKGCDKLIKNELQQDFIPSEIKVAPVLDERNKTRTAFEKGFGQRVAYVLFGIPQNCIEGLFVGRKTENDKKMLANLKLLFPDCYICNIDGKVIVE